MNDKEIRVDYLARVEGEGALYLKIKDKKAAEVQLNIFEPPRFFEAFLQGRSFKEVPDITARICGICPVAYQMSSTHAMENAAGIILHPELRELRRLLYCGEWIESHVLHLAMLHAPDFLGYQDALAMAKDHPKIVEAALKLKKTGNDIVNLVGGREIHPINVRVGGFYHLPSKKEMNELLEKLKWGRDAARQLLAWTVTLPFPDFERDYVFVSLQHEKEYPFNEGRIVSSSGLDIAVADYEKHFEEIHVAHSNALHSVIKGQGSYHVGPLARYSLNFDRLSDLAKDEALKAGLGKTCKNPFKSIAIRAVETLYAYDEAIRIVEKYQPPEKAAVDFVPTNAVGYAATEAPRGTLYHRYQMDEKGNIVVAKIVPPTSQNLRTMEEDVALFFERIADADEEKITHDLEQAVRNYDPCISCATHFLNITLDHAT